MSLLMGALGGLGKGMAEVGVLTLKEEADAKRSANLERIANKQYSQSRTDKLDDVKSSQDYQAGLTKDQRALDSAAKIEDRKLFEGDRASTLANQKELETFRAGLNPTEAKLNPLLAKFLDADAKIRGSFKEGGNYADLNKLLKANRDQYGALGLDLGNIPEDEGFIDEQAIIDAKEAKEAADKKIVDDRNAAIDIEQQSINDENKRSATEEYVANGGNADDLIPPGSNIVDAIAKPFNWYGGLIKDGLEVSRTQQSAAGLKSWRDGDRNNRSAEQVVNNPQATLEERQQAQNYINATK